MFFRQCAKVQALIKLLNRHKANNEVLRVIPKNMNKRKSHTQNKHVALPAHFEHRFGLIFASAVLRSCGCGSLMLLRATCSPKRILDSVRERHPTNKF